MPNAKFTRDEVILALDVLYNSGEKHFTKNSPAIQELSQILNQLPVHAQQDRRAIFRNPSGVARQIVRFRATSRKEITVSDVGDIFYTVAEEYANRHEELHEIAAAIRRNLSFYDSVPFGSDWEADGFPEGALLGHMHRVIEERDGSRIDVGGRCAICEIETDGIYRSCPELMKPHLTVPILILDPKKRYIPDLFITVCPNCHAALHRHRPWLTKAFCGRILR